MANGNDTILVGSLQLDLKTLDQNVKTANALLDSIGQNASAHVQTLTQTYTNLGNVIANAAKTAKQAWAATPANANSVKLLKDTTAAFRALKTTQSEYMIAMNTGNATQRSYWQSRNDEIYKQIFLLEAEANKLSQNDKLRNQIVDTINKMKNAQDSFNDKVDKFKMPDYLKKSQTALRELQSSMSQYSKAVAANDTQSAAYWQTRMDASMVELRNIESAIPNLQLDADTRNKILDIINKAKAAQRDFNAETQKSPDIVNGLASGFDKIYNTMRLITGLSFVKIFKDALDQAKQFDKAIVDIAIVTQQSAESAREMGSMYRDLANDLNVTSVDLATAAATVYRQGYTDNQEVSDIITGATKFGAVSDLTTAESIKSMTASLQNFREEGESAKEIVDRIGDTWSYLGDAVATEGADIADAMGKASASVASVGLGFERASAYAAVMLARTQQTGEVIGTQLNSLASRYAKVTSTGYKKITSDDEGEALSFNDISKALQKAGIEMYDTVNKTFMPLGEVLDELAPKWYTLDEATQKYIATAMAGTRGMNYFLTLMKDHNLALDLEDAAKNNAGVVDEKYLIWMHGVEAAQNNLTNSMEQFYSVLSANTLADFYNGLARVVDVINGATEATDGWNIKLPLAAAGIMSVIVMISKFITVLQGLAKVSGTLSKASFISTLLSGNIGLIVGGVAAITTVIGAIAVAANRSKIDIEKLNEEISLNQTEVNKWYAISSAIENLGGKTEGTTEYQEQFNDIRKQIVADSPLLQSMYGAEGEAIKNLGMASEITAEKMKALNAEQKLLYANSIDINRNKYDESIAKYYGEAYDQSIAKESFENYSKAYMSFEEALKMWLYDNSSLDLSDASYSTLMGYKQVIEQIESMDEFGKIEFGSSIFEGLDDFYTKITLLMDVRNSDIEEQKESLKGIFMGLVYEDRDLSEAFAGNSEGLTQAIADFLKGNFLGVDREEIEAMFIDYIAMVADIAKGTFDREDVGIAGFLTLKLNKYGIDTSIVDEYIEAYQEAIKILKSHPSFAALSFTELIDSGALSTQILNAFNAVTENLDEDELLQKLRELLAMTPEELEEWALNIPVNVDPDGSGREELEEYAKMLKGIVSPANDVQNAIKKLAMGEKLLASEAEDILNVYPEIADEMLEYADNTEDATKLIKALNKAQSDHAIRKWADDLSSALNTLDNATEGTYEYDKALTALGDVFGSGLGNLDSPSFAVQNLDNIRAAANGSVEAFRALQEAAFVNIVGTSQADFSAVLNGIQLVSENSIAMAEWLASLGLFTVETVKTTSYQEIIDGITGATVPVQANGTYKILKPMSTNPFKAKTGGGSGKSSSGGGGGGSKGGGGGGGSSISVSEKTTKLLDGMEKANEAFENRKTITDLRKEYHEIRGEIQGVIGYTEEESKIIEEQNRVLEANVSKLEAEIKSKEAIMSKNKESSKAYKQASVDLDELNEAHKEYTEALLENKNRLEEIRKELEEFDEDARQATISVQELVRETLESEEDYQREMLDATIDLEDEILDVITARYEKEQELLIETAEAKKEAIQAEIDAIDELIESREKLIKKEEQEQEIAELEAKIARISADPTRKKELLKLQEELAEKRKDMAWESYTEEMEAQKESLEEQITNIDDYIDYVNDYYEELFKNPKKLIEEMQEIIKMSDEEIIKWLSENQEEFSSYSEKKKEQTIQNWQDMIDSMRGVTETYKEEIEEIMSWTDEEIIAWLKEHNIEFKNATKEQQESFLYTWKQTLEEWRNAYKKVSTDVSAPQYSNGNSSGGSGGSGGGGGSGGSGGSSGGTSSKPKSYSGKAAFQYKVHGGGWSANYASTATSTMSQANATLLAATSAFNKARSAAASHYKEAYANSKTGRDKMLSLLENASMSNPGKLLKRAYKTGGLVYETGPAWLDGTRMKPERVLSAYQTQLFEDLLATLHTIKTFSVGGLGPINTPDIKRGQSSFNIEQITVQVDHLDDDTDYELMATKVGDILRREVTRLMPNGGLII